MTLEDCDKLCICNYQPLKNLHKKYTQGKYR